MTVDVTPLLRVAAHTLRASLPLVLRVPDSATSALADALVDRWSAALLRDFGVRVRVRGAERLRGWRPALVMSNHQSHIDVPVLYQVIPAPLRMVAKQELARVPVWGAAMRAAGMIFVDRGDRARAIVSLELAKRQLAGGVNVWIAPEGTRSTDGALGPFKKGGFVLAEEVGAEIVPVTIDGTRRVLPAHSLRTSRGIEVTVTVHPRVAPSDHPDRASRMEAVRAAIASALPRS